MSLARLSQLRAIRPIAPAYFTSADYPWLRTLLDERERFVGQKRRDWKVRAAQPLPIEAPRRKLRVALRVLDRQAQDQTRCAVSPRKIRALLFHAAAQHPRTEALASTAAALRLSPAQVMDGLFADLPGERALAPLREPLDPSALALACNEAVVASLLSKALRVRITARGRVRAVVRHAKLMGLVCHALSGPCHDEVVLEISGPYALFRHTRIYGRALASLIPRLAWCHRFRLEADCVLGSEGSEVGRLILTSGDPLAPARELPTFDSKVEERFARAFAKVAPEWDLIREPRALTLGETLVFPDFELRHRTRGERWLLEIVGFWTTDYLRRKLSQLRAANVERLIVCIDEARDCGEPSLEALGHVVRYRRKLDPKAVLAILEPRIA